MNGACEEYRRRYPALREVAKLLQTHVQTYLEGLPNIDRVTARAKDPDHFAEKANRIDEKGQLYYGNPLTEIQDQLGARVVVFYKADVEPVDQLVRRYFQPIEQKELLPESEWAFGYFGLHLVLALPRDVVPNDVNLATVPRFFELQIKTLFQHAWSEANHDLGYKSRSHLSADQQRRLAYTAAQAWGADRVFDELRFELVAAASSSH